jgi:hypothetical protein
VVVMKNISSKHSFKVETLKIAMGEIGSDSVGVKGEEKKEEGLKSDQEEEVGSETEVLGASTGLVKEEQLEKLPIKVELVGKKEDYLNLLLAMEEAIPLLSINKLDLKSGKNETVRMEMTVAVYFSPPKGSLDLDKINLSDLMMTEDELAAADRLEGFENHTSGLSGVGPNKPSVIREDPFRF